MFLSLHTMLHSYVHVTGNAGWAGVGWGGVGMLTFGWSWTRHWCYAEHGVGWGCERSFEVEHVTDATLSMGWGGDVNVRLKLNTPLMLRWAWGGVGMWTFVWSWTRHWCYAEHGVGWGGDVNVRLKLNTLLMLRWAWGGVGMLTYIGCSCYRFWGVYHNSGCHTSVDTVFDNGNDKVEYIRSWQWRWENALCPDLLKKNSTGLHAQWSLKLARQKKVRILCGRVAKRKKNDFF